MATQPYLRIDEDGQPYFHADAFAITVQQIMDDDYPYPPFRAAVREFPDLVGHGYMVTEAIGMLMRQIEQHYRESLETGQNFPKPELMGGQP